MKGWIQMNQKMNFKKLSKSIFATALAGALVIGGVPVAGVEQVRILSSK